MATLDQDLAEGNLSKEEYDREVAGLEQQTMAAMEVLQGRIYGPQGMRTVPTTGARANVEPGATWGA